MPELLLTTSASQLSTYAACGRRYFYRYIARAEPEFRSESLALGSAARSTVGWWFRQRLKGRQPTFQAAHEIFAADFAADTVPFTMRWKSESPSQVESDGQSRLRAYLSVHGDLPVVAVDQRYEVSIKNPDTGEPLPRSLVGYFDLVLRKCSGLMLVKLTSSQLSARNPRCQLQIGSCVTAAHALYRGPIRVASHAILRRSVPRIEEYSVNDIERARRWFYASARDIEAAIRLGRSPASQGQKCVDCEFRNRCSSEWGRDVYPRKVNVRDASQRVVRLRTEAA